MSDTLICPPGLAETPVLTVAEVIKKLHDRLYTASLWYVPNCRDDAMVQTVTEALALCDLLLPAVRKAQREGV